MGVKSKLLVTVADSNFFSQAKAMLASVYFNGGWKGDYAVVTPGMLDSEENWFKERGVRVIHSDMRRKFIPQKFNSEWGALPAEYDKLLIFSEIMKRWDQVVYLDSDIIVRHSLEPLALVDRFAVCRNLFATSLRSQFIKNIDSLEKKELFGKVSTKYNLKSEAFNAGVMAFPTAIIGSNTIDELLNLAEEFAPIVQSADQAILNLFFLNNRIMLPSAYNHYPRQFSSLFEQKSRFCPEGIVLHFTRYHEYARPWHPSNAYYDEWCQLLKRADSIDFSRPIKGASSLSPFKITLISSYIDKARLAQRYYSRVNRLLKKVGEFA